MFLLFKFIKYYKLSMKSQKIYDEDIIQAYITYCGKTNIGKLRSFKRSTLTYNEFYNKINQRYGGKTKLQITFIKDDKSQIIFDHSSNQQNKFQLLIKQSKELKCKVKVIEQNQQSVQNLVKQVKEINGINNISYTSKFQQKVKEVPQNNKKNMKHSLNNLTSKPSSQRQKQIAMQNKIKQKDKDKQKQQNKVELAQPLKQLTTMTKKKGKVIQANTVKQQIPKDTLNHNEEINPNYTMIHSFEYEVQENDSVGKVWVNNSINNKSIQNITQSKNKSANLIPIQTPSTSSNLSTPFTNLIDQSPYQPNNRNQINTLGKSVIQNKIIDYQLQQLKKQLQTSAAYLKEIMVALGITCLQCKIQNFSGPYYQCLICVNKYLCSSCEQQTQLKNHPQRSHPFAKLKQEGESVNNIQIRTTTIRDIRLADQDSLENQNEEIISTDSYMHSRI